MQYFLDFDGVIFDIHAFKAHMETLGFAHAQRSAALFAAMREVDPTFTVKQYVFPDARIFLEEHKTSCHVVSSYVSSNPHQTQNQEEAAAYQTEKIALAGITQLLGEAHIHVVGASKEEMLRSLHEACLQKDEAGVFVDDNVSHVRRAAELGIRSFLMDRTHTMQEDDLVHVASFVDLTERIHSENSQRI